jgi:hypothetical protein
MVMIIGGIIISILVGVVPLIFVNDRVNETREILANMDYALQGYLSVNKRMPCPDTNGNGQENRDDNGSPAVFTDDSCSTYQGNIPYVTLGIVSDEDVWKNRLYYGVYEDLIQTGSSSFCTDLKDFITAAATSHSENPGETSKLYVTSRAVTPNSSTNMAYVLISGGLKDYDGSDTRFDGFNSSAPSNQFECEERFVEDDYDDIVKTRSFSYLYGKLCTGNQWWE